MSRAGTARRYRPGALPAVLTTLAAAACESPQPPAACGPIPQVTVNAKETTAVTACFNDPNGDVLSYTATSSNTGVATVSVSGPNISVAALLPGGTTVTVTATDPGGLQGQQGFQVMVPNRAPEPRGTMPPMTVVAGRVGTADAAAYFTEPDGQPLTYAATSSNETTATVTMAGSTVTVAAVAKGTTTVTVTARDPVGLTARQSFEVTVPNRAPVAVGSIADLEVDMDTIAEVDVAEHFDDPDGDPLTYAASSSNPARASVSVSGSVVTVRGVLIGAATVTVTASDPEGLTARQTFRASVVNPDRRVLGVLHDALGGGGWTEDTNWTTDAPLDEWYGVTTNEAGRVVRLDLRENGLAGQIPAEVGRLRFLERLDLALNRVDESPPESADDTGRLERAGFPRDAHEGLGGGEAGPRGDPGWRLAGASSPPSAGGIRAPEGPGRSMALRSNGITGPIPRELASLSNLKELWLAGNSLSGPIPPELENLSRLKHLWLSWNALTGAIPTELGDLSNLEYLYLHDNDLTGSIPPELGNLSRLEVLSLNLNALTGGIPRELGNLSNLKGLWLYGNSLTGAIPPELENLSELEYLRLRGNSLTGRIPRELGDLSSLKELVLLYNELTGTIPRELGNLSSLEYLNLSGNSLAGRIPTELGDLSNLQYLYLATNELTGTIPPELGDLSRLLHLSLANNELTGTVPRVLGDLSDLERLLLSTNELVGTIPSDLVGLPLAYFWWFENTGLCAPSAEALQDWLRSIENHRGGPTCLGPAAYLVQAVQSRTDPVPVVAEKEALLRVFVTATRTTTESLPPARATFYVDGSRTYSVNIDGRSETIPTEINEGSLDQSLNVTIPDAVIEEGLSVVIDIDPDSTIDAGILAARRIPENGELDLGVEAVPDFELTAIPFLYTKDPDSSVLDVVEDMESDEEDHELLHDTYDLLPIEEMSVGDHDPVEIDSDDLVNVLYRTRAIRAAEGGSGYWLGLMAKERRGVIGVAFRPGTSSASILDASTIAHELGHNISLWHAPCGGPSRVDPNYPHDYGYIGAWGYDHRGDSLVDKDEARDLMTYCDPAWISDYHFEKAADYRIAQAMKDEATSGRTGPSLLVWGSRSASGELSMDPALVVEGRSLLPDAPGDYALTGLDGAGRELLSISFDMEEPDDAEEGTGVFVFLLPAQPGWEELASLALSGPGDALFTLDGGTESTMALIRDARSGQVRAIRGDFNERPDVPSGYVVRWSRGIPDRDAWRLR